MKSLDFLVIRDTTKSAGLMQAVDSLQKGKLVRALSVK